MIFPILLISFSCDETVTDSEVYNGDVLGSWMLTGLTGLEPQTKPSVLHFRINTLKFLETLAYFFNARTEFPNNIPIRGKSKAKTPKMNEAVDLAKKKFQEEAFETLNINIDKPDPTGSGGNTGLNHV